MTFAIIALTAIISFLALNNEALFARLRFNAWDVKHNNHWYRFFTYGLIHADFFHLLVNMLVLFSFGRIVESYFAVLFPEKAKFYYLLMYAGGLILSVLPAFGKHKNDVFYNAVGASGAVAAILFSAIILHPTGSIYLFFIPIPIPAPVFGVLYIAYEYYISKRANDNIGHDAHLWGAIFGIVFTIALKPALAARFFSEIFG